MDKDRGANKYDGFKYYQSKLYTDPESSYNSHYANYFKSFCKQYENVDNSQYCIFDLQGAYGKWGCMIKNLVGAKKCIVTDYSDGMVEYGKTIQPEDEAEFYNLGFDESLTDERVTKHKYCGVLIKEAIHFTQPGYAEKLMNFLKNHCTENAFILCNGVLTTKYWKETPIYFPPTAIESLKNMKYDDIDFANECKELTKDNKEICVQYKIEPIRYKWSLEDFVIFLANRNWSCMRPVPEEELQQYIEFAKNQKLAEIEYDIYYGFIEIFKKK